MQKKNPKMEGKDAAKFRFPQCSLLGCWYFKYCCVLVRSFLFSCHNSSSVTSPWVWKEWNTKWPFIKPLQLCPMSFMALTPEYVYGLGGQCHPRLGNQGDGLTVVTVVFISGNSFLRMLNLRGTDFEFSCHPRCQNTLLLCDKHQGWDIVQD